MNELLRELAEAMKYVQTFRASMESGLRPPMSDVELELASFLFKHHAAIEQAVRDAERYRWLLTRQNAHDNKPFICIYHGNFGMWNGEHAEREIDAAMAQEKAK